MELPAAVLITDHLPAPPEVPREQVLQLQGAAVHRTGRFTQGPAQQLRKAGRLIPVLLVVQHQDHQDHPTAGRVPQDRHLTADPAVQDRPPIAGPVLQDHRHTADQAPAVHIPVEAGLAVRPVPIPAVAADRQAAVLLLLPLQAVAADQAVQVLAQEDSTGCPG
jgi:hypothetical protein